MVELTIVQAINKALHDEMKNDKNIVVLGEDVGVNGGVFRVTDGLIQKYGSKRVMDTPLAERGIIGTAVGMAVYGLRPIAEIQFMGFLYQGFDQLICHASRIRYRSRGRFTCPLVVRMPYGGGVHAPEHHSESTEAILAHTPGLIVLCPSTPEDAYGLLVSAIRSNDPVIFLEPKRLYRSVKGEVSSKPYSIEIGKAKITRPGTALTIISWGSMMEQVKLAVEETGVDAEVIDLRTISPIDTETIITSVKKTGRCVIVHEAARTCGLGAEIIAQIHEKAIYDLEAPVVRVTGFDTIMPLLKTENYYLPNKDRIIKGIKEVLG